MEETNRLKQLSRQPVNIPEDVQIVPTVPSKKVNKVLRKNYKQIKRSITAREQTTSAAAFEILKYPSLLVLAWLAAMFLLESELFAAKIFSGIVVILVICTGPAIFFMMHKYENYLRTEKRMVEPEHWDVATRLWGVLNKEKKTLPSYMKKLAEERLGYAISAAEILDWAEANNIPDSDYQVVVARKELKEGYVFLTSVFETKVEPYTKEYTQHFPYETFPESLSNVHVLVWEWKQHLLPNGNETYESFVKEVGLTKVPHITDVTKRLRKFLHAQKSTSFSVPSEVTDLVQQYLPVTDAVVEVIREARRWHTIKNSQSLAVAQRMLSNISDVYRIVVVCEDISQEVGTVFEAEKSRPKNIATGENANEVKQLKHLRRAEETEWGFTP